MIHEVQVDDKTSIQVEERGEGKPLVLLHGWPLNKNMFKWQLEELSARGFRVYAIDLRGFGDSDKPHMNYTYNVFAEDVKKVIDELEIEGYYLAGFSMGGAAAIRHAAKFADERLEKLVLIGAAAPSFTQRQGYTLGQDRDQVDELIKNMQSDREATLKEFQSMFFYQDVAQDVKDSLISMGSQASEYAMVSSGEELRDADLRDEMGEIHVPVTILHGRHDNICEFAFAEEMERMIPTADLVPFEESGHGIYYEEKQKVNEEIVKLLKQ
ncbi:alpha/beta fold hydrolase [Alkalicoccus chagannorensis]|uniref:alpha/beta fold hydrolase n=1 Tax=Alkalicoccus chagannorensis TaxID=427072 RepID=UPI000420822D|nr:alpha/beta hydrolase [Alkalicoccus chagannorensis]